MHTRVQDANAAARLTAGLMTVLGTVAARSLQGFPSVHSIVLLSSTGAVTGLVIQTAVHRAPSADINLIALIRMSHSYTTVATHLQLSPDSQTPLPHSGADNNDRP